MAYMSQDNKKALAPAIKAVCKKYGVKATLAVRHHSTLVLNISKSPLDLLKGTDRDHLQVNPYWLDRDYDGKERDFLKEVVNAMNNGNFDKSDLMSDYHHVGWYIDINVGRFDKPYVLEA